MVREIELSQGLVAIIDDCDYERVSKYKWYAVQNGNSFYAERAKRLSRQKIKLHRFILNVPDDMVVDHINGSGLDCRRSNMRICSQAENNRNRGPKTGSTSQYKGVYWYKRGKKWRTRITIDGKVISLGVYNTEEEAAHAYDIAAREYHGEFAWLNFRE